MSGEERRGGPRGRREHERRPDRNGDDHGREEYEDEAYDDPGEHLEIERRRFAGGLLPTPELYALAREQWYRLPGVVLRPSMDPVVGDPAANEAPPAGQANPDGKAPGQ
jgi:hypothetical protein